MKGRQNDEREGIASRKRVNGRSKEGWTLGRKDEERKEEGKEGRRVNGGTDEKRDVWKDRQSQ